jgi:hypothetical protein
MFRGRHLTLCLIASSMVFTLACASVSPPSGQISEAEAAIRQAESMGAVEFAPLPMRIAREKLDESRAIVQKGKDDQMTRAKRLAEEATVEARLAEETARTAALKKARDDAQQTIDAMRREAGLDAE